MASPPLDAIDRGILYHLQVDASQPVTAIADRLDVVDNTVRNRIENLEASGVITGYRAVLDYDRAGIQHYYMFVCTVAVGDREAVTAQLLEVPGVVDVTTVMTGRQNVFVTAAAPTKPAITEIAYELDRLGAAIDREHLIWSQTVQPYSGFRPDVPGGQER